MLEGMYSAAAGMEAQQARLDALSNDMANTNTTGYKRVRVAFRDLLYTPSGRGAAPGVASGAGSAATAVGRNDDQGALQATARKFDLALEGPGYLQVRDARGRAVLTRDGSLQRRADGELVTSGGNPTGVRIPQGVTDDQVVIGADGTVRARGTAIGRLQLVSVRAPEALRSLGSNLLGTTAASGAPTAAGAGTRVLQGSLEASNVNLADTMVDLTDAQRSFQMMSKAISTQDQMLEIANGVKR